MYILFFLLLVKMTVVVFLLTPTDLLGAVCEMFFSQKMKKALIGIEPTTSILDGRCPSFYLVIFCGLLRSQLYPSLYDLLQ